MIPRRWDYNKGAMRANRSASTAGDFLCFFYSKAYDAVAIAAELDNLQNWAVPVPSKHTKFVQEVRTG